VDFPELPSAGPKLEEDAAKLQEILEEKSFCREPRPSSRVCRGPEKEAKAVSASLEAQGFRPDSSGMSLLLFVSFKAAGRRLGGKEHADAAVEDRARPRDLLTNEQTNTAQAFVLIKGLIDSRGSALCRSRAPVAGRPSQSTEESPSRGASVESARKKWEAHALKVSALISLTSRRRGSWRTSGASAMESRQSWLRSEVVVGG